SRRHPRRRLGPDSDGERPGQPAPLGAADRLRCVDRLSRAAQHQLQRARSADRVHARGGLRYVPVHGHGRRAPRALPRPEGGPPMTRARYLGVLFTDLWAFARAYRAWWMLPLVLALLVLGFLVVASQWSSGFVYVLF